MGGPNHILQHVPSENPTQNPTTGPTVDGCPIMSNFELTNNTNIHTKVLSLLLCIYSFVAFSSFIEANFSLLL
jgi:hypothetical protein